MSPKTPVVAPRAEGAQKTLSDRNQVTLSPPTETAEAAAHEVEHVISYVNLMILEALKGLQERLARLRLSQLKRADEERVNVAVETGVLH